MSMIPRPNAAFIHLWLAARYPRWTITFDRSLAVWGAERKLPGGVRFVADHSPAGLRAKIEQAEGRS